MRTRPERLTAALLTTVSLAATAAAQEEDDPGRALLTETCGGCHSATDGGGLSRMEGQRKTPEGWMMTVVRMEQFHGLSVSPGDRRAIVQYLADTQGLAPSEAAPYRYALEKVPHAVEAFDEPFAAMCARCHTGARALLQNRSAEEWLLHMDFHVGQFPTIEYQALGRDREWYRIAREEIAPWLAETRPLETEAWAEWRAAERPAVTGDWVLLTALPEGGEAYGALSISGEASPYAVTGEVVTADGTRHEVSGEMNLYTGYEWRANLDIGGTAYRQVLALSEDGSALAGRQFLHDNDSLGAPLTAARADGAPMILGTVPSAVPAGAAEVQVVGAGLDAAESAAGQIAANPHGARLTFEAEGNGTVTVTAGAAETRVAHYASIDALVVEPAFTIARVGGGSEVGPGTVPAQFAAYGLWNGPDGEAGTEDDIRIGRIDAAWRVENLHAHAEKMQDTRHAGAMGPDGIFEPAVAGPNPERPFSANNAGELTVIAEALGHSAEAQLIVTVQRFIDPPIR
ncbi:quinohemoprotein amine dehydrogenase subunit alpha [Roseivivax sp. CAU 1761]